MKELKVFFTALQFYTRIPCPAWVNYNDDNFAKSTRYLPLIGWIIGGITAFITFASALLFQQDIAIVLGMIAGIILTGAFHEDGFADTCDGFGGGWTKQKILDIMKDSRVGAYGVIGISLLLLLKFLAIKQIPTHVLYTSLICSHSLSRLATVFLIRFSSYVRIGMDAKAKVNKISTAGFLCSIILGLLPLFLFNNFYALLIIIPLFFTQYFLGRYFKKWIGGYTGDCLGAVQQITEVVCYLSIYLFHNYVNNTGFIETLIYKQ